MDLDTLAYAVRELKKDVKEIKEDVKSLMLFMAVKKAEDKRATMVISGIISFVVSIAAAVAVKFLG